MLHLAGSDVAEAHKDDLIILVEELETSLDDDLFFVSSLNRILHH